MLSLIWCPSQRSCTLYILHCLLYWWCTPWEAQPFQSSWGKSWWGSTSSKKPKRPISGHMQAVGLSSGLSLTRLCCSCTHASCLLQCIVVLCVSCHPMLVLSLTKQPYGIDTHIRAMLVWMLARCFCVAVHAASEMRQATLESLRNLQMSRSDQLCGFMTCTQLYSGMGW